VPPFRGGAPVEACPAVTSAPYRNRAGRSILILRPMASLKPPGRPVEASFHHLLAPLPDASAQARRTLWVETDRATKGEPTCRESLSRGGWRSRSRSTPEPAAAPATALPGRPGIFVGTHGDGVLFSEDGARWEERNSGLAIKDVYTLASVAEAGSITLYAGTQPAALFKSRDLAREIKGRHYNGGRQPATGLCCDRRRAARRPAP